MPDDRQPTEVAYHLKSVSVNVHFGLSTKQSKSSLKSRIVMNSMIQTAGLAVQDTVRYSVRTISYCHIVRPHQNGLTELH